jgi:hypothetical protein
MSDFDQPCRIEAFDLSDRSEWAEPGQQAKVERRSEEIANSIGSVADRGNAAEGMIGSSEASI